MKLILAIVLSLGLAQTASAGFGDFFKTKPISKRMLKTVKRNHLVVAKVTHPARGLKLFDACFNGQNIVSKSGATANRCVEFEYTIDNDDKNDVPAHEWVLTAAQWEAQGRSGRFGSFYTPSCVKFEKYTPVGSINRTRRQEVNCRWVQGKDLPIGHYAEGNSEQDFDWFNICDYITVPSTFPLTQTIQVHRLHDNFSDKVYYHSSHHDRAQPGYQKFTYTIPHCKDLGDKDLPDTRK